MYCFSILLCDQRADTYWAFEKTLQNMGYFAQVQYVTTLASAVKLLNKASFDLALIHSNSSCLESHEFMQIKSQNVPVILVGKIDPMSHGLGTSSYMDWLNPQYTPHDLHVAVQRFITWHSNNVHVKQVVYFKTGRSLTRVSYADIVYIQANGQSCMVYTPNNSFPIKHTITEIQVLLPASMFRRVQKSYIVSLFKIEVVHPNHIQVGEYTIPVGKSFKKNIQYLYDILQKPKQID